MDDPEKDHDFTPHGRQSEPALEYVFGGQTKKHSLAFAAPKVPVDFPPGQARHEDKESAPSELEYFPNGQGVQKMLPMVTESE